MILIHLLLIICNTFILIVCIKLFIRNEKVFKFRRYVLINDDDCLAMYQRLPPYLNMLLSNKPLQLESYFTDEEIQKLYENRNRANN